MFRRKQYPRYRIVQTRDVLMEEGEVVRPAQFLVQEFNWWPFGLHIWSDLTYPVPAIGEYSLPTRRAYTFETAEAARSWLDKMLVEKAEAKVRKSQRKAFPRTVETVY